MRFALPQLLRHAALTLPAQQRSAESMAEQRLLQGDAGPFAPRLQPEIAAQLELALAARIVESTPSGDGGHAQDAGGDAARRRSKSGPKPRDEGRAGKQEGRP